MNRPPLGSLSPNPYARNEVSAKGGGGRGGVRLSFNSPVVRGGPRALKFDSPERNAAVAAVAAPLIDEFAVTASSSVPVTEPTAPLWGFVVPLKFEEVLEISPNFPAIRSAEECVKVINPYKGVRPIDIIRNPTLALHEQLNGALESEVFFDGAALQNLAPPGVYTWLLYCSRDVPEVRFVAKQTLSLWELGTRHGAIACDSRLRLLPEAEGGVAGLVYGGGELKKTASGIEFNLLSGTFTKIMVDSLRRKTARTGVDHLGAYTDAVVGEVKRLVSPALTFVPAEVDGVQASTFLTHHRVGPVAPTVLARYRAHGFTIDPASEADCVECEAAADAKVAKAMNNTARVLEFGPRSSFASPSRRTRQGKARRAARKNRKRVTRRR